MEAVFIHLCDRITQPTKEKTSGRLVYISRWKRILSEYNSVRARMRNSEELEGVNLVLYTVNETSLVRWYKDQTRRDEIKILMQGQALSCAADKLAADKLPPAQERPSLPNPPPKKPHIFTTTHCNNSSR